MRTLMVNRADAFTVPGGDTVQMMETKSALEKMGVEVYVSLHGTEFPEENFDITHIFNWEQLEPYIRSSKPEIIEKLPVVLSTIFWFHTGHWFAGAVSKRSVWWIFQKAIGETTTRNFYEKWQQTKFCYGKMGGELRRNLLAVNHLLPNSEIELDHIRSVLNLSKKGSYSVVPNGIKKELFEPLPSPNEVFFKEYRLDGFVLEVARIQSAKNQKGLIEALMDNPVPIVFVGQPSPYEVDYVKECYELAKMRGRVYFVPPKTPTELAGIYRLAAVHVLPSWRETPGLVSLEAAAAGCKIVTTNLGSAREYFGNQAWYCDPRDNSSILQAVNHALSAPPSNALRERVLDRYTWEVAAQKTLKAYQLATSTSPGG